MTFLAFFGGGGVATALCLPVRFHDDLALGPVDASSVDSALGTRTEIWMVGIRSSPLKQGRAEAKLSKACIME
jgi:hypothetical protein